MGNDASKSLKCQFMIVKKISGGSCSFAVFYSIGWLRVEVGRTPPEIAIGFQAT